MYDTYYNILLSLLSSFILYDTRLRRGRLSPAAVVVLVFGCAELLLDGGGDGGERTVRVTRPDSLVNLRRQWGRAVHGSIEVEDREESHKQQREQRRQQAYCTSEVCAKARRCGPKNVRELTSRRHAAHCCTIESLDGRCYLLHTTLQSGMPGGQLCPLWGLQMFSSGTYSHPPAMY